MKTSSRIIKDMNELTPVDNIDGMWFKRDDLYQPFDDIPLNGDKIKQCNRVVSALADEINDKYDGRVFSAGGMHSPQGIIITRCCKEYGLDPTMFYGATKFDSVIKHDIIRHILNMGGNVNIRCKLGYESTIISNTINHFPYEGFNIGFGMNIGRDDLLCNDVQRQVQNIPDELDNLVIPTGSAIIASAILRGIAQYGKRVKDIHCVQIAGHDRVKTIERLCEGYDVPDFYFHLSKDYAYTRFVKYTLADGTRLDPIYEGKAYDFMLRYMPQCKNDGKTLFWIVGNTNDIRETPADKREYTMDENMTISLAR